EEEREGCGRGGGRGAGAERRFAEPPVGDGRRDGDRRGDHAGGFPLRAAPLDLLAAGGARHGGVLALGFPSPQERRDPVRSLAHSEPARKRASKSSAAGVEARGAAGGGADGAEGTTCLSDGGAGGGSGHAAALIAAPPLRTSPDVTRHSNGVPRDIWRTPTYL